METVFVGSSGGKDHDSTHKLHIMAVRGLGSIRIPTPHRTWWGLACSTAQRCPRRGKGGCWSCGLGRFVHGLHANPRPHIWARAHTHIHKCTRTHTHTSKARACTCSHMQPRASSRQQNMHLGIYLHSHWLPTAACACSDWKPWVWRFRCRFLAGTEWASPWSSAGRASVGDTRAVGWRVDPGLCCGRDCAWCSRWQT